MEDSRDPASLAPSGICHHRSQPRLQGSLGEGCDTSTPLSLSLSTPNPVGAESVLFTTAPSVPHPGKKLTSFPSVPLLSQPPPPQFPSLNAGSPRLAVPRLSTKVPGTPQDILQSITWGFPR